jgi:ribonuclease PH
MVLFIHMRIDGREYDQLRPVVMERGYCKYAEGSCFIQIGDTHVLVTASVEDRVPPFLRNSGKGWLTAEYSMLPRSGRTRSQRDSQKGANGRSMEIQRLIGRVLRTVVDLDALGERTITVDCDVIRADGGTRTASITGAYVAVYDALEWMVKKRMISKNLISEPVAAISVGIIRGKELLDLNYEEDSTAQTDMNLAMTASGKFIEIQGTAETAPFGVDVLGRLLKIGKQGIDELIVKQQEALGLLSVG